MHLITPIAVNHTITATLISFHIDWHIMVCCTGLVLKEPKSNTFVRLRTESG